jgi:hypothetical protein
MRVRIDEARHYNTSARVYNFSIANILFDFIARTDPLDLPLTDEHSPVRNDPERG